MLYSILGNHKFNYYDGMQIDQTLRQMADELRSTVYFHRVDRFGEIYVKDVKTGKVYPTNSYLTIENRPYNKRRAERRFREDEDRRRWEDYLRRQEELDDSEARTDFDSPPLFTRKSQQDSPDLREMFDPDNPFEFLKPRETPEPEDPFNPFEEADDEPLIIAMLNRDETQEAHKRENREDSSDLEPIPYPPRRRRSVRVGEVYLIRSLTNPSEYVQIPTETVIQAIDSGLDIERFGAELYYAHVDPDGNMLDFDVSEEEIDEYERDRFI